MPSTPRHRRLLTRTPNPVHAVPVDGPPRPKDHRASSLCWCRPEPTHRDLATASIIFVPTDPPAEKREERP